MVVVNSAAEVLKPSNSDTIELYLFSHSEIVSEFEFAVSNLELSSETSDFKAEISVLKAALSAVKVVISKFFELSVSFNSETRPSIPAVDSESSAFNNLISSSAASTLS